jgi:subtilase family serine protease
MRPDKNQVLYADVLIQSAGGKSVEPDSEITAETLHLYTPSERDVDTVRSYFENSGFQTTALAGISIGINGPAQLFEQFFETIIYQNEQGYFSIHPENEVTDFELPAEVLSNAVADLVQTITFSPPIDFGPKGSFL